MRESWQWTLRALTVIAIYYSVRMTMFSFVLQSVNVRNDYVVI